jgi:hypothetical protein
VELSGDEPWEPVVTTPHPTDVVTANVVLGMPGRVSPTCVRLQVTATRERFFRHGATAAHAEIEEVTPHGRERDADVAADDVVEAGTERDDPLGSDRHAVEAGCTSLRRPAS